MEYLLKFLPLIKVLAAFAVMLAGIRARLGLGSSVLAGGLVLGLCFGLGPVPWLKVAGLALIQEKTVLLSAIVGLILVLSGLLETTGQTGRIMEALSAFISGPRLRLVFFPALIGLLPMPGGAVFSAPMIKGVARDMGVSDMDKALINYWFRHVWEMCWPLYPGIILAASLAEVSIADFLTYTCPGTVFSLVLGWFFLLRPGVLRLDSAPLPERGVGDARRALVQAAPLVMAIAGALGLEGLVSLAAPGLPFELGIIAALALAVACVAFQNRLGWRDLARAALRRSLFSMLYVVAAVFVFKDLLQAAGVVGQLSVLAGGEVALFAAAVFLPALVGLVSGLTVAFVGATFPLLLGLVSGLGLEAGRMAYLVLAMFAGFCGVMASPLHICFILTCQYFKLDLSAAWKRVLAPSLLLFCLGAAYFWLIL
ncbi:MAG: DUF401 family protein [Desulfovibrionaceae bacterium]|nr:DUF401 family protein [Desulfovibrionaceae bacterium]